MRATLRIPNDMMMGTGKSTPMSIPASIKGWDQISSIAKMAEDHAVQLDNWIPRPGYLEIRRGSVAWATGVGTATTPVETVMAYTAPVGTNSKLFAVAGGTIYDCTAGGAASATTVTGLSSSRMQFCNFTNAANTSYLICCNGVDTPKIYNGTVWANLNVTGITMGDIVAVNAWKGRLWFTLINSTKSAYMAVGTIAGAATVFDLGSFMTRGGFLECIATWTQDSKQTVDEYLAFITSRGQVIVYQGTDPATANTFALVGLYDIGAPIGRRCFLRISGNLWIICVDGILPMSEMLTLDRAAAAKVAPTTMIQNAMMASARQFNGNFGWQMIEYAKGQLAILNIPQVENNTSVQYVMNTLTGAWCQFVGMSANCWEVLNDVPYWGGNDGTVWQWDNGSGDGNNAITATVQTAFNYFGSRGHLKRWTMVRPIITTDGTVTPGVGLNVDFGTGAPISIPSVASSGGALWDVALWDQAVWPINSAISANWTTIEGIGQCASIITKVATVSNGQSNGVVLQLNSWDLIAEPGKAFF